LIEHDGEDLRHLPRLRWRTRLRLASCLTSTLSRMGRPCSPVRGGSGKRVDGAYRSGPCRVWIKVRNPASIAVQREQSAIWNR
jgi:hypothetical protein